MKRCPKCDGKDDTACYIPNQGRDPECPMWPPKGWDKNLNRVEEKA